ncbi:DUF3164 family protein [Methylophaga nitratireducenticrescens]|uniref:DUF3164 family protein n=1 Tax=Methylophaga nitratireducenticrescens TaxID=754476 RepID=UPI000CDC0BCC|nr:DUF3164 family protein [Methylophaga nitratireducenticrescens]AUZ85807.1 sulfate transporter [Methylophaga nitratireducenticrescens]AUZ85875.1 sulfate transporter [Methylophaga nitratireducenticrescens]
MNSPDQAEYRKNALGHLVPIDAIKRVDLDRDELISELFSKARALRSDMIDFKTLATGDVSAFVDLVAEKYGKQLGGKKGNITLLSFDGCQKIQISIQEHLHFDERILAAKEIIYDCVAKWTADSNDNVKALIDLAFKADKDGRLATGKILSLLRLEIDDEEWEKAMEALKDSIQIIGSTSYIRFYQRPSANEKFQQVSLDLASM